MVRWIIAAMSVTILLSGCSSKSPDALPPDDPISAPPFRDSTSGPTGSLSPVVHTEDLPTSFGQPTVYNNQLIWLGWPDEDSSRRSVYIKDLHSDKIRTICESEHPLLTGFPTMANEWIICYLSHSGQPEVRLVAHNLTTGEERFLFTGSHEFFMIVEAQGRFVAWVEREWGTMEASWSRLFIYDFDTDTSTLLKETAFPQNIESISVYGNTLVFTMFTLEVVDEEKRFASNVYRLDLDANNRIEVLSTSDTAWQARIYGNYVIWKDAPHFSDYGELVLYSLADQQAITITDFGTAVGLTGATIGNGFVTWRELLGTGRIPVYLIAEHKLVVLDETEVYAPRAYGDYLTWSKRKESVSESYVMRWWTPHH